MRAGYCFGLSQTDQTLTLVLNTLPATLCANTLEKRLAGLLAFEPGSLPLKTDWSHGQTIVMVLAARIIQLAAEFQRSVYLPALDPGKILSCVPLPDDKDSWRLLLAVPHIDDFPQSTLNTLYGQVTTLVLKLADTAWLPPPAETLFQEIDTAVRNPLRAVMPLSQSTFHLLRVAQSLQMPWRHVGNGVFQIGWGARQTRIRSSQVFSDSTLGTDTVQHKYWAAQWLRQAGLPTASQGIADTEDQVIELARQLNNSVVIKPVDRDRGEGITLRPTGPEALRQAFQTARQYSAQVLVEAWVPGVCHRVLVVNGALVYCVKRLPIAIQGNGQHTIETLISSHNALRSALPPWHRKPPLPDDANAVECLLRQGFTLGSVLQKGQWAALRETESTAWGGIDLELTGQIHPANIDLALRAAGIFGLACAGVDIMSTDITRPWYENGAIINEVNAAPTLGGGPASLRTLPDVVKRLLPEGARIPIEVYIGGPGAEHKARARYMQLGIQNVAAWFCAFNQTLAPNDTPHICTGPSLFDRCLQLLANPAVEHLVLLVNTTAPLATGLPFDDCTRVEVIDPEKCQSAPSGALASEHDTRQLLAMFRAKR